MDLQLTTRLGHLRLSGMVDASPAPSPKPRCPAPRISGIPRTTSLARRADQLFGPRLRQADIPVVKTLAAFDWTYNSKIPKTKLVELVCGRFINNHQGGVLLIGPPASANPMRHATAIGAIRAGRRALVRSTFDLATGLRPGQVHARSS